MLGRTGKLAFLAKNLQRSCPASSRFVVQSNFQSVRNMSGIIPFKLADIGEGIAEVELLEWFVKEGDNIKTFDRVCQVQSDKANVEITSRYEGKITKLYGKVGDIIKVGSSLIDISSDAVVATPVAAPPAAPVAKAAPVATSGGKIVPFKLADIGEGIAEVELLEWFLKEGDKIKAFDRVCQVQSDKANVEITSRFEGTVVKCYGKVGEILKVGGTLIDIQTADGKVVTVGETQQTAPSSSSSHAAPAAVAASHGHNYEATIGKFLTTPAVRRIARENHLNLALVRATGPKGRILKEDVLNFIKNGGNAAAATAAATTAASASHAAPASVSAPVSSGATTVVPIRGIQRLMVKSMTESLKIQHLTYCEEVVFDKLKTLRAALKTELAKKGIKLSYLPIMIKAASQSLGHYPLLNASLNKEATELTYHQSHNIGVAMDTPKGLLVPVLRDVQNKTIVQIAQELAVLQDAAGKGTLTEAQLGGATFSLSNIGSIGGTYATPVIVPPMVGIGAFGRLQVLPRYIDPKTGGPADVETIEDGLAVVEPVTIMNVSWSADHRVVDGATVARFSNKFKACIENPTLMLAEMK